MSEYGRETRKRAQNEKVKRAREQFMMLVLLLALVPTILCIILFSKQARLKSDMEGLEQKLEKYEKQGQGTGGGGGDYAGVGAFSPTPSQTPADTPSATPADALPQGQDPGPTATAGEGDTPDLTLSAMEGRPITVTPGADGKPISGTEQGGSVKAGDEELTPTPTPTLAVDPETGEALPWADKKVYITFDDGPSKYTDELLDLLAQYDVKATFFVIGHEGENYARLYKRIVEEGHTIGMHSYSHDYGKIYKSVEDFEKDFTKISNLLYDNIGYVPDLYRFPGGSSNSKCKALTIQPFIRFLLDKDVRYFDWNVENGDATGKGYSVEELAQNLMDGVEKKTTSVVLCHDTNSKERTLESMKIVLPALIEKGAQILPITADTQMVRHVKPAEEE